MKLESAKDVCHELATNPRTCPKMSHMRASVANFLCTDAYRYTFNHACRSTIGIRWRLSLCALAVSL